MIRSLVFDPSNDRVRRPRFVRRPCVPLEAACVVANGVREGLRTLIGETALTIGEPVAIDAGAWRSLAHDAFSFITPGRVTDVIFVVSRRDARSLVQAAFGESAGEHRGAWSALEGGAIERMMARCANAVDVLCVERRGTTRAIEADGEIPPCIAFFDVRVTSPVTLTLGVALTRELPQAPPAITLGPTMLAGVTAPVTVVLGRGHVPASSLLDLRVGSTVMLKTKVDGDGELNFAGQRIAIGRCGVVHGHAAFEVGPSI